MSGIKIHVLFCFLVVIFGCIGSLLLHVGFSLVEVHSLMHLRCTSALPMIWDLRSQPGIKLMPPALESRFLTIGPPGQSLKFPFLKWLPVSSLTLWSLSHLNGLPPRFSHPCWPTSLSSAECGSPVGVAQCGVGRAWLVIPVCQLLPSSLTSGDVHL